MSFDLTGRTALITGASRGIGAAITLALARAGADVAINSRGQEALDALAGQVRALGRRALVLPADVTDPDAARGMVTAAIDGLGSLDVLVSGSELIRDLRGCGQQPIGLP